MQKEEPRELKYCIIIEARDEQNVMEPYFAHMVKHKTKQLIIRLIVPKEKIVEKVRKMTYADLKMDICVQGNTDDCLLQEYAYGDEKEKMVYEYSVPDANVNYTYALEWGFTS